MMIHKLPDPLSTMGLPVDNYTLDSWSISMMRRSNALYKHSINEHSTEQPNFVSKPIQSGFKYNLDRFIFESIKIQHGNLDNNINCLNSRAEWGHRGLPRLQINHD